MEEKVQDMGRSLQDLTEEERKDVLSCLTKFLSEDGQLQDLEQSVRVPQKQRGQREKPVGRQVVY